MAKIFLIGMMGTGKSHWAKYLAKKLKTAGYDLDYLVETHEEKTIAEIFATDGEAVFRKTEAKLLRWFVQKNAFVLATGGGTPCFEGNMDWMKQQGITIWIDEPVEILVQRAKQGLSHRPAIQGLSDEQIQALFQQRLAERRVFYSQAAYHLQSPVQEIDFIKIIRSHA